MVAKFEQTSIDVPTVVFFWKMVELNKVCIQCMFLRDTHPEIVYQKFRSFIFSSEKSTDLVVYLLCFCMDAKDKPRKYDLSQNVKQ